IYTSDPKRAPIIAFNYVIVLCWFLFLYIFPSKDVGKGVQKISLAHLFLAFCVLASIIINSFLLSDLYSEYYEEKDTKPLSGIGYALVSLIVLAGLTMIFSTDN